MNNSLQHEKKLYNSLHSKKKSGEYSTITPIIGHDWLKRSNRSIGNGFDLNTWFNCWADVLAFLLAVAVVCAILVYDWLTIAGGGTG